ncbi:MAG TPA: MFS transporter [Candidatus Limnocylindrales bacterium]|nr:MFS transporter [Candidatus Limnocylindrales bacterium]
MTDARPAAMGNGAVLRLPAFRKLFAAQTISNVGDGMTYMALMLLVNALTHSTAALAVLAIAVAVPSMVGGIVGGAVADRFDRRRIMLASDTARAILVLGFTVVATADRLPILYLVAFAQAAIGTLFSPARGALIPRAVPAEGLMAANGLGQLSNVVCSLLGTTVTGIVFALTGSAWPVFILDAVTFLASVAIVYRVDRALGTPSHEAHVAGASFASSVTAGLRVIAASRTLIATLLGLFVAMLGMGAINILFVPFLINVLHESPAWVGPVEGAQTLSMVLAAALIGTLASRFSARSMVVGGLAGTGVVIALFSQVPNVWVLFPLAFLVGWFVTPLNAAVSTLVQTTAKDAMRGRVLGALNAAMSTATIVSTAAAGVFGAAIGIRMVVLIGGLLCIAAAVGTGVLFWLDGRRVATPAGAAAPTPATLAPETTLLPEATLARDVALAHEA